MLIKNGTHCNFFYSLRFKHSCRSVRSFFKRCTVSVGPSNHRDIRLVFSLYLCNNSVPFSIWLLANKLSFKWLKAWYRQSVDNMPLLTNAYSLGVSFECHILRTYYTLQGSTEPQFLICRSAILFKSIKLCNWYLQFNKRYKYFGASVVYFFLMINN